MARRVLKVALHALGIIIGLGLTVTFARALRTADAPVPAVTLTDASVTCFSGGREFFTQTGVARVTFIDSGILLTDPTQPSRQVRVLGSCSVAGTVP